MSSMVRTCEARSASAGSLVGRSLSLRAACRQAWLRERSALLCRLLDISFFITASMSATSQGGALEMACMPKRMMCNARHVTGFSCDHWQLQKGVYMSCQVEAMCVVS